MVATRTLRLSFCLKRFRDGFWWCGAAEQRGKSVRFKVRRERDSRSTGADLEEILSGTLSGTLSWTSDAADVSSLVDNE